jgi:hypothetical protein
MVSLYFLIMAGPDTATRLLRVSYKDRFAI